jgi:predicted O-methyltransferase YrrM
MDLKRFKENLVSLLLTPSGDNPFAALRIITHGMSGVRTAKILNFAAKCMAPGEFYLEVGTFSGYTLISAGYQLNALCIGVDDLSMNELVKPESKENGKKCVRALLDKNLGEYGTPNTRFVESSFKTVDLSENSRGKLSVLFIDGDHTREEVKATLEKFAPSFSPNAVIVFDDVQFGGISTYIAELMSGNEFEMLAYLVSTPHEHDRTVHQNMFLDEHIANGICVMARKGTANA